MPKGTAPDSEATLSEIPDVDDTADDQEIEDDDADLDDAPDDAPEGDEEDDDEGDDEDGDEPLREEGKKALDRMKALVKDLKKSVRDLKAENESLRNGDDEDDELTVAQRERETERTKRIEAEKKLAAKTAGLPESWWKRLEGDDFDDFLDDAETLAADMPNPQERRKGGGGAKDGHQKRKPPSLDDQIAEAEKKGDMAEARRLKAQKVHELRQAQG